MKNYEQLLEMAEKDPAIKKMREQQIELQAKQDRLDTILSLPPAEQRKQFDNEHIGAAYKIESAELKKHTAIAELIFFGTIISAAAVGGICIFALPACRIAPLLMPLGLFGGFGGGMGYFQAAQRRFIPRKVDKFVSSQYAGERQKVSGSLETLKKDEATAVNTYIHNKIKEMGIPLDGDENPSVIEDEGIIDVDGVKLKVKNQ